MGESDDEHLELLKAEWESLGVSGPEMDEKIRIWKELNVVVVEKPVLSDLERRVAVDGVIREESLLKSCFWMALVGMTLAAVAAPITYYLVYWAKYALMGIGFAIAVVGTLTYHRTSLAHRTTAILTYCASFLVAYMWYDVIALSSEHSVAPAGVCCAAIPGSSSRPRCPRRCTTASPCAWCSRCRSSCSRSPGAVATKEISRLTMPGPRSRLLPEPGKPIMAAGIVRIPPSATPGVPRLAIAHPAPIGRCDHPVHPANRRGPSLAAWFSILLGPMPFT